MALAPKILAALGMVGLSQACSGAPSVTYTDQHDVRVGWDVEGDALIDRVVDCITLSYPDSRSVSFSFLLRGSTGDTCDMQGVGRLASDGLYEYREPLPEHIENTGECVLRLAVSEERVLLTDVGHRCATFNHCGMRAHIDGALFSRVEERPDECAE